MKPNVRNLSIGLKGEDIRLLHEGLEKLGYIISSDEKKKKFFGPTTRNAIIKLQIKHKLQGTGIVDEATIDKFYELAQREGLLNVSRKFLTGTRVADPKVKKASVMPKPKLEFTFDSIKNFNFPQENPGKKDIASLHAALKKLKLDIAPEEINRNEMGRTTRAAIQKIQKQVGLKTDGKLSPETIEKFKVELEHGFYKDNKTRTEKIHGMLEHLGQKIDPDDIKSRTFGKSTEKAIKQFQKKVGFPIDGRLNENLVNKLNEEALKVRFSTKTQVGQLQRTLLRAAQIARLELNIDPKELKEKELGATSTAVIRAFQKKYALDETGELNPATYERMKSVAASRPIPIKTLKVKSADKLSPISRALRLNMTGKHVGELQQSLAFLNYEIDEKEFKTRTFGKTTREAVIEYQRKNSLPVSGHAEGITLKMLNKDIQQVNPQTSDVAYPFRVRGSVRDELWRGKAGVKVQVWEKPLRGEGTLLAERKTLSDGFFDVPYDPPRNPSDRQIKSTFHLQIKILDQNNIVLQKKVLFNPTLIAWVNFTEGDEPYRGTSEYEEKMKAVTKALNNISIAEIEQTDQQQEITHIALNSGLSPEDVMRLALSHRAARKLNDPTIEPEIFYAFIRQNLPPNLPSDLLGSTEEWTRIDKLVDQTINGLVFMEGDLQTQALNNAIKENFIPIAQGRQKEKIITSLSSLRKDFTLNKPILIGNGSLISLLDASKVDQKHYNEIASVFLKHRGLGSGFWEDVKSRANEFGGEASIKDFETTVNLGQITKNHVSTLSFLKAKINNPDTSGPRINKIQDLAKLTHTSWVDLIKENGGIVPDSTDDTTPEEKINVYANILASQSEQLFPAIAFAAEAGRSNQHQLTKITEIQQLLDTQADLDLRADNLDKYVKEKQLVVAEDVLTQARVMQRVHRIAPTAAVGRALLDEKIHHSAGIISLGKEKFVGLLEGKGIGQRIALTVYGHAEFQYAQILTRIADYRFELHRADPRAIVKYTYTAEEQQEFLKGIPNLKTLFGSLDFCDCQHCQSVYGPCAYLADVLRFLENHNSKKAGKTVKDNLFERRPDIGNIKLNCDNTNTPIPYIDMVCEILENAVPAPNTNENFSFQTTRTKDELRAFPENVRKDAYEALKTANYPMNTSFNLWQEESRIFLQHLGISRHELMESFQARPAGGVYSPLDIGIAGEFWNMSSHETNITVTRANTTPQQDEFWGLDSTRNKIIVSDFIQHAKIEYTELLEMLYVKCLNPSEATDKLILERPVDSCNTETQHLVNLSVDKFDQIHRFLRLWRHTDWKMWELDLLIRSAKVGNSKIDADTLVRLKQFRQVQEKIGLAFEPALSFYHQINTEVRVIPEQPQKEIQPLYINLFRNPANPGDEKFALPLSGGENLSDHKPTLLAAFAITEVDLALILGKTDGKLNLFNLTYIFNYVNLAKGLKITIKDLIILQNLSGVPDVFASPKQTLDFIELHEWLKSSGFEIQELDYLLNYQPDSPYGLREEVVTQYIQSLRESLRSNSAATKQGQIISQIANSYSITDEQSRLLLEKLDLLDPIMQQVDKLTEKNSNDKYIWDITPGNFQSIYDSYRLLHKASMLVKRHNIEHKEDLEWLLTKYDIFKSLNFSALPINSNPAQPLFQAWLTLCKWLYFKSQYPQPEGVSLNSIFDLAGNPTTSKADVLKAISKLTTWKVEDLESLDSGWQLRQGAISDYTDIDIYIRLWRCFEQIKRIGVESGMLLNWAKRDEDTNEMQFVTAQQIQQAAKSKYDYSVWLSKVTPMQDELREKKRDALTKYLIERSLRTEQKEITFSGKKFMNPGYWKDSNDLLSYFLIDVEMSACQPTSRIKQAISSIQMFVQRCFLNLEQPNVEVSREEKEDAVSLNSWKQWKWMKNYRIWEANRKVFLYPENWIEPELRDDKSPFFKELENELSQNEITTENAESAFLNYLQKVHEISRLDIAGVYHELDDDDPHDNLPPNIDILHVIGRTKSQPAIYYYRQFDLNYNTWTAWEKIELDVTGDHVIPVVYNRKLYLFWLVFMEKPQKVKKMPPARTSETPTDSPEPSKTLEIQLAWSVRKDKGWTSKKVSHQKLIHPWERPQYTYNLKPRYKNRENLLWLDIYISTSLEFNNTRFYDPYRSTDNLQYVTAVRYAETVRPWHSSSFIFDGEVIDLKLKGLAGQYHILDSKGIASENLVPTTSYQYIHDNFGVEARAIEKLNGRYEIAPRLTLPDGMHYRYTHLANNKTTLNANQLNILESGGTKTLLMGAKSPFELIFSQHQIRFDTVTWGKVPFFYQDNFRPFFIKPEWEELIVGSNQTLERLKYLFYPFYHPYTALFIRELNRTGLEGLLNRRIQLYPESYYPGNNFNFDDYKPNSPNAPDTTAKKDIVDFGLYGAYSIYNWELFFHAPLMIACKLSQNQRFEEAMRWFHYIFDPTNVEALGVPQRYWVTKPFFIENSDDYRKQRIEKLLESIDDNLDQLRAWKNNPFKPHLIARYRPVAYQKAVVMKYIDNLIAWGDQLFRRDTMESMNEATMLYVLAYELLGPRPIKVPNIGHKDYSYNELVADGNLDPFGNKKVDVLMENFTGTPVRVVRTLEGSEPMPRLDIFYFCLPNNDKLLEYWGKVEDRLFKIRHCMNIQGVVRQLPLFEPPIDPALLVKAAAAGVDLSSVLSDVAAPPGQYRFRLLAQKAVEFCGEIRALGDKLLSILEKNDAEGLALLRSVNEIKLLEAVKEIRKQQIKEGKETWAGLEKAKESAEEKKNFYESREFMNLFEGAAMTFGGVSALAETAIAAGYIMAGGLAFIPKFVAGASGFGGSPEVNASPVDGLRFSKAAEAAVQTLSAIARASDKWGSLASSMGIYWRRKEEWDFQGRLANIEIKQLERQIEAARIRYIIAEKELENQELQIEQTKSVDEYMRSKYTNQQLYDWMLRQLATIYFQSYQLAFDMAKRAEKCYQFELGKADASFIQFGYWDSLKKGLLAGEKLANDIRRMETAYIDQNKRELEITKHISLVQFFPFSLLTLKETGSCVAVLPEWLFDMDYPGHFRRRIKSVSITIPCVTGPYTNVNCMLSLTNNGVRVNDDVSGGYGDPLTANDTRFARNPVPVQSIATSHGQNDAGVFELNFNDERYLPFEGAGAVSEWQIKLPGESNQFDFATVSDVILHIRYTAIAGSIDLANSANNHLNEILPTGGLKLLDLKHEFSTEWHRFLHPDTNIDQELAFTLKLEHLPFYARIRSVNKNIRLSRLDLILESAYDGSFNASLQLPGANAPSNELMSKDPNFGDMPHLEKSNILPLTNALGDWNIKLKKNTDTTFKLLKPEDIRNAYLIIRFNIQ
ncbi:MAG: peptidoglycan-binding protein [Candidatus Methanoperedens sp.]|nr:peptidoglycan-binding protein [Candidatus Methanoperedens sp.]CAG0978769.1 Toxin subunit YenA2 [Methanosarcinales archaeon]